MKRMLTGIAALPLLAATPALAQARGAIIHAAGFTSTGSEQPLTGTQTGITENLPGGSWVRGAGEWYNERDMGDGHPRIWNDWIAAYGPGYKPNVADTAIHDTIL
ncbi:MAG: hypothetical protein FWF96_06265, partial [Kiritimatiellaeota bacterium]|nr:hypothetical protein [Kiritimatiellota bacterium]